MKFFLGLLVLGWFFFPLLGKVEFSILPEMEEIYHKDLGKRVNRFQKLLIHQAREHENEKLRVITYNMLYNLPDAEAKLPAKHRWEERKVRLKDYVLFAKADIIGSQELQEDQVKDLMNFVSDDYDYYGEKIRENEGRGDINAIFYKKGRFELLKGETRLFPHEVYQNGFTICHFKDRVTDRDFIVVNTKLSFGDAERRIDEALQLLDFVKSSPQDVPILLTGDLNTFPCIQHQRNPFLDGDYTLKILESTTLKHARSQSIFGHFGPLCSLTTSKFTLKPFAGPQLTGFIFDHIFVNPFIEVLTHGIDVAKVNGEFPSDHFPVVVDIFFR